MSTYTGPGLYQIVPSFAQNMSLNVWDGEKTTGTPIKLYQRTSSDKNAHFEIVSAGGTQGKSEIGDREYHIIAANSGLYLASNDSGKLTTELRPPLNTSIRWKIVYVGNGTFNINTADGKKQMNVEGGNKESGTQIITYNITDHASAQFIFRAV